MGILAGELPRPFDLGIRINSTSDEDCNADVGRGNFCTERFGYWDKEKDGCG